MLPALMGSISTTDAKGVGYVARGGAVGPFELRAAFGVGLVYTAALMIDHSLPADSNSAEGVFPTAEAAIRLSYPLGRTWAIGVGPVVTWYGQELNAETSDSPIYPTYYESVSFQRGLEVMGFAAIQHRM